MKLDEAYNALDKAADAVCAAEEALEKARSEHADARINLNRAIQAAKKESTQ